jgi:hypothetical protein
LFLVLGADGSLDQEQGQGKGGGREERGREEWRDGGEQERKEERVVVPIFIV